MGDVLGRERAAAVQVIAGTCSLALSLHLNANADVSILAWWASLAIIGLGLWRIHRRCAQWSALALPLATLPTGYVLTNAIVALLE